MRAALTLFLLLISFACKDSSDNPLYKNASASIEDRVADLVGRMTLEEKVAQMWCVWQQKGRLLLDSTGLFDAEKTKANFPHGLGQVEGLATQKVVWTPALLTNSIQKYFVEEWFGSVIMSNRHPQQRPKKVSWIVLDEQINRFCSKARV